MAAATTAVLPGAGRCGKDVVNVSELMFDRDLAKALASPIRVVSAIPGMIPVRVAQKRVDFVGRQTRILSGLRWARGVAAVSSACHDACSIGRHRSMYGACGRTRPTLC